MRLPVTRLTLESGADIMRLRHSARVIAETVNLSAPDQTRLVTAVSEVARNYVQAGGGALTDFHIRENGDGYSLLATLRTDGQGEIHGDEILGNLERSTARRLVHDFEMEGDPNELVIRLSMNLPALEDGETMETLASRAMDAVTQTVAWLDWSPQVADAIDPFPEARLALTGFYVLTGLHALHALGGLLSLGWVLTVVRPGDRHGLWPHATYWHFLDIAWVFVWLLLLLAR